jgi:hypothetical protein
VCQYLSDNLNEDSNVGDIIKVGLKLEKHNGSTMQSKIKGPTKDFITLFHHSSLLFENL